MRWLLTIAVLLGLLTSCRPNDRQLADGSGLTITIETGAEPRLGTIPLVVLLERDGEPVAGAEVRVAGDMTHAGMIPVLRDAVETAPGVYRAEDFEFTMAGDWIVTVDATLPDGEKVSGELRTGVPGN